MARIFFAGFFKKKAGKGSPAPLPSFWVCLGGRVCCCRECKNCWTDAFALPLEFLYTLLAIWTNHPRAKTGCLIISAIRQQKPRPHSRGNKTRAHTLEKRNKLGIFSRGVSCGKHASCHMRVVCPIKPVYGFITGSLFWDNRLPQESKRMGVDLEYHGVVWDFWFGRRQKRSERERGSATTPDLRKKCVRFIPIKTRPGSYGKKVHSSVNDRAPNSIVFVVQFRIFACSEFFSFFRDWQILCELSFISSNYRNVA